MLETLLGPHVTGVQDHGFASPAEPSTCLVSVPCGRLDVRPVGYDSDPVLVDAQVVDHRLGETFVDRYKSVRTSQGEGL